MRGFGGVGDGDGVALAEGVADGLGVVDGDGEGVGVAVGDGLAVADELSDGVDEGDAEVEGAVVAAGAAPVQRSTCAQPESAVVATRATAAMTVAREVRVLITPHETAPGRRGANRRATS